jgi:response regulator RpfG family c-di-GMP phosphodiesterase
MTEKMTILYIDDEPINIMLFVKIFEKEFNVITGLSGFEGLDKLNQFPEIKMVFCDMKMPGMNGIEFITQAGKKHKDKTFFLITGYGVTEDIANALENKTVSKYFSKPFNVVEIKKTIKEIVNQ